jgi:hypothetical protein
MPWLVCARCCRTCCSADLLQISEIDLVVQDVAAAVGVCTTRPGVSLDVEANHLAKGLGRAWRSGKRRGTASIRRSLGLPARSGT